MENLKCKRSSMKKCFVVFLLVICTLALLSGCAKQTSAIDYANQNNWAYYENNQVDKKADVFFICPTVYMGSENNMPLDDEETKASFLGAINMERGIYDTDSRFFAPYYRQMGLNGYKQDQELQEEYLNSAYLDVKAAFEYYLKNENNGNPIILAGFSQGSDMCYRLLKDCFKDKKINDLLVACYAIGWGITEQEIYDNPHLKFATGEKDAGVIISFNSEAENIAESLMIPKSTKALAINPLNWKTDGTVADKSENMGACFTNYDGEILKEIPQFCGGYIDTGRGSLKLPDITPEEYPAGLDIFEDGVYHLYDYQFFYRNLQKNVEVRLNTYLASNHK